MALLSITGGPITYRVPEHYATIKEAIEAIPEGAGEVVILVEPGVYPDWLRIERKKVTIRNTDPARAVIVADPSGHRGVIELHASKVILDHIHITSNGRGRGMYVEDSRLWMRECRVFGNRVSTYAFSDGRGAAMEAYRSTIRIEDCAIERNRIDFSFGTPTNGFGGALFFKDRCDVEIVSSSISANETHSHTNFPSTANGGGMWCEESRLTMVGCRVSGNRCDGWATYGGGIYLRNMLRAELVDCTITGNAITQPHGGGIYVNGNSQAVKLTNTTFGSNEPSDFATARESVPRSRTTTGVMLAMA